MTYTGYASVFYLIQAYTLLFLLSYADVLLIYEHLWHFLFKNVSAVSLNTLRVYTSCLG